MSASPSPAPSSHELVIDLSNDDIHVERTVFAAMPEPPKLVPVHAEDEPLLDRIRQAQVARRPWLYRFFDGTATPDDLAHLQRDAERQQEAEASARMPGTGSGPWLTRQESRMIVREGSDSTMVPLRARVIFAVLAAAHNGEAISSRALRDAVSGRGADIDRERDALAAEGLIERRPGRNGGWVYWPAGFEADEPDIDLDDIDLDEDEPDDRGAFDLTA